MSGPETKSGAASIFIVSSRSFLAQRCKPYSLDQQWGTVFQPTVPEPYFRPVPATQPDGILNLKTWRATDWVERMPVGRSPGKEKSAKYRIVVQGELDGNWSEWLGGMAVTYEARGDDTGVTTLTGTVTDQSALRGILSRIWDLNLIVISVDRIDAGWQQGRRRQK